MTTIAHPLPAASSRRLTGYRKWLARALWLAVALPLIALEVVAAGPYMRSLQTICSTSPSECGNQLTVENAAALSTEGVSLAGYGVWVGGIAMLSLFVWQGVGLLLFFLRSDDWMALLVSLFLIVFSGATFSSDLLNYAVGAYPQLGPVMIGLNMLGELLVTAFFLLFPNGRLVPRWLWWLLIIRPVIALSDYVTIFSINETIYGVLFFVPISRYSC